MEHTTLTAKDQAIFEQRPPLRALGGDERRAHLANRTAGVLATVTATGHPHLTTVIYAWDPVTDTVRISTRSSRAKVANIARGGRAALFVEGPDMWSFVVAEGDAEVSPVSSQAGDATGRELLELFPQADSAAEAAFLEEQVAEARVVIRLHVKRLYGDIIELPRRADEPTHGEAADR